MVELEGTYGRVKEISLRSTAILTMDNILVDIPNQKIVESKIINHTYNRHIRMRTRVGVAYKTSIPQAQQVLLDLVRNNDQFLTDPAPEVIVVDYADSSIILELQVWIRDSRHEILLDNEITENIKAAFDKAGIQIPFPHRQVFIESIPVNELREASMKGVVD